MDTIERIRQELLITDILPELTSKKVINCPFPDHDDRNASFTYYAETISFYCFGCGKGGSVIDLLMHLENLNYDAALHRAAVIAGVQIFNMSPEETQRQKNAHHREEILNSVTKVFEDKLWNEDDVATRARNYITRRGWSEDLMRGNRVGLANIERLKAANRFSNDDLVQAGLLKEETYKPLFKGWRLFFPTIHGNRVIHGTFRNF